MKFALIIGHKESRQGACNSKKDICEWSYNKELTSDIIRSYNGTHEMLQVFRNTLSGLPYEVNQMGVDFAVSFHCNAYYGEATGTEVLYYYDSKRSEEAAKIFQGKIVEALGLRDRGIKAIDEDDRGGIILTHTSMPCILLEPFFIDNDSDLEIADSNKDKLIQNIVEAFDIVAEEVLKRNV